MLLVALYFNFSIFLNICDMFSFRTWGWEGKLRLYIMKYAVRLSDFFFTNNCVRMKNVLETKFHLNLY